MAANQVVLYKKKQTSSKNKQKHWKSRLSYPWSCYCDLRAILAVVAYLHCSGKKIHVSAPEITLFINAGRWGKITTERKKDLKEAFDDRREAEVAEIVKVSLPILVGEGVLMPECDYIIGQVYRICLDEIKVLNYTHRKLYPKKGKSREKMLPVLQLS